MDFYSFIRMTNYIRKEKPTAAFVMSCKPTTAPWNDDKYLTPVSQWTFENIFNIQFFKIIFNFRQLKMIQC